METSTALERAMPTVPIPTMNDAEIESTWRVAKALAASRFFKDATQAEAAFAKILLGRDLGLSPTEAMGALHVFDGKVEASADFHATRVKASPDHDYAVVELTNEKAAITFYGPPDGEEIGTSTFTIEDADLAGLAKKDVWKKYPRNMLFARAMSNGVAWFCPEVMGAVRVYAPGEAQDAADDRTIGGASDDDVAGPLHEDPALAERAERMLARAREAGHAGLMNRGAAAMALRGQPPEVVEGWLSVAGSILDKTEPEDATVVDGDDGDPVPPPELGPDTLRKMAADTRADAAEAKTEEDAASLHGEADELEARADALETGDDEATQQKMEMES